MNQKHDRQKLVEIARNTLIATDERCARVFSFAWLFLFIVLIFSSSSPALGICFWYDPDEPTPTPEENCKKCKELDIGPSSPCWEWCEQHYPYNNCSQNICSLPQVCPWAIAKNPDSLAYQVDQNIQFSIAADVNAWLASHSECSTGEQNTYWNFGDGQTSAGLNNRTVNHAYSGNGHFNVRSVFQLVFPNPGTNPTAECYADTSVTVGSLPDLIITSITSPTTGEAGGSIPTQVIIKNQGALDAGAFGLAFLLSKDASITLSDINTGIGCSFNSLAKGASYSCSGSIKIPESTPDGIYYFGAYVDSGQHITESNEANNGLAAANSIKIGGDATWVELFPTAVSGPATAVAGGMIDVSAQVVNQGALDAKQFWLDFFLSTDKAIKLTDLNTVYGCYYKQLAAGSDDTCSLSILIPPYTPNGSYYLGVYADSLQKVTEFDELNNGLAANAPMYISGGDEPFWDVPPSNWAYWYIHAMRDAGITTGCGNGNFCPSGLVTRDQMAAFLVRAIEGDPPSNLCAAGSPFSDVPWNVWYCSHVKRLVDLAITGGCGQGKYCPGNLVTREQMAAFIVRAKEGEPPQNYCGGVAPFKDVPASAWSCGYIKKLVELGITQGCGNGNYCPGANVSREQMAAFLARAFLGMD